MPSTISSNKPPRIHVSLLWKRVERFFEFSLPLLIIVLIVLSWFIAHRYQKTRIETAIVSYQETQLEVVRSVARSIRFYVENQLAHGVGINDIEQQILKRFVAPIHLLENGDAWIYAPDRVVFDLSSDFPEIYRGKSIREIFALQQVKGAFHFEEMSKAVETASEGVGWYVWLPGKGKEIASWTPVRFEDYVWTIGLSTPLNEILEATGTERRERLINTLMALATLFGGGFSITALWGFRHRRKLQQAAEQHNRDLQSMVASLEREVQRRTQSEKDLIQAEAERKKLSEQLMHAQKMEAIGTLAGGVAHDLNNILSGIVSYPDLLLASMPPDSPLFNPLKTIQTAGEQAAGIVQDLLTMARRGVGSKEIVNLNTVITEYLKSPSHLKKALQSPRVRIETRLDENLLNLRGAPGDLTKIVMNLIINALEALEGTGTITIVTENSYIDGQHSGTRNIDEGEYVHLRIVDTGRGIDANDLPRLFEPFYTKKKLGMSGSGLGLAVVWGTVQDHLGVIDAQSTPGEGTTFDVYLPATRKEPPHAEKTIDRENLLAKGESILVVDDIPLQRDIARHILEMFGYRVDTVDSGEAAVTYFETQAVDLVVLDMIMGEGMDGLDTYRSIVARYPGQKAIIASGFSETERVHDAQELGAGAYVKKPFLMEALALAVREELDR